MLAVMAHCVRDFYTEGLVSHRLVFEFMKDIPRSDEECSGLLYLAEAGKKKARRLVKIQCPCGKHFIAHLSDIRHGKTTQCPDCRYEQIRQSKLKDKTGNRYGRLLVTGRAPGIDMWYCRCDCGVEKLLVGCRLVTGNTRSCGCLHREQLSELTGSNYAPGTVIGLFTILEKLPSNKHGTQRYRVFDAYTGKIKVHLQRHITQWATLLGRFMWRCQARFRAAYRSDRLTKTDSFLKFFGYTREDFFNSLGPLPGPEYHIDHICPVSLAKTEAEVIKLYSLVNLQYLLGTENSSKGNKWTPEGANIHALLLNRTWEEPCKL